MSSKVKIICAEVFLRHFDVDLVVTASCQIHLGYVGILEQSVARFFGQVSESPFADISEQFDGQHLTAVRQKRNLRSFCILR
jgi:hypothetical protein